FGDDDQDREDDDGTREGSGDNENIDSDYVGIDVNASSAAQSVSPPKTMRKQVKGGTSSKRKSEVQTLSRMEVVVSRGQEYYVRAVKYFEKEEYANMFLALEGDEQRMGDENIRHACMILALQELHDSAEDNLDSITIPSTRQPRRERGESGAEFIHRLLTETPTECQIQLRLDRNMFIQLVNLMIERDIILDAKYVKVAEQVGICLYILGKGLSYRDASDKFKHSISTLCKYHNEVLKAMVNLSFDIIRPHRDLFEVPPEVANGTRYWPYFKDAIGALDGTLIDAIVSDTDGVPFRDRHGKKSWNVLACCSFDRIYTFNNVGWEGSVHDTMVWKDSLGNPQFNFPHPPPDSMEIVRHDIALRIWRANRSESDNEGDKNQDQSNNEDDENANHMEVDG
uniref:DDE Tnp4 domain-containing protein n=1 Tax=Chenopodium quinoa TaxID=63459 RepID=A0A803N0H3_CHEQI